MVIVQTLFTWAQAWITRSTGIWVAVTLVYDMAFQHPSFWTGHVYCLFLSFFLTVLFYSRDVSGVWICFEFFLLLLHILQENLQRSCWESHSFRTEIRTSSQSAPLFAENKSDKRKPIRLSSSRRFSTYVLPTPGGTKSPSNTGSDSPLSQTLRTSESARTHSLWHSSPLDGKKLDKILEEERLSKSITQSGLRESNSNISATGLPPPLADGLLISRLDPHGASDSKKIKRQAFSGPLTSKPWPTKPFSKEHSRLFSVPIQRPRSSSPKVSPCPSPPLMSSPKISELHELPRPPASPSLKSSRPIGYVGHSAPLLPRCQFQTTRNESAKRRTSASPLPTPPQAITRSFSIPSSNNLNEVVETSKAMETSPSYALVSPPLTPISLRKPSRGSTTVQIVEIRGNAWPGAFVSLISLK